jgi:hypothetical protein
MLLRAHDAPAYMNTLVCCAGRRNVHVKSTGYRQHMSIMHICNAAGTSLPPLYIFQGKHTKKNLLHGAPNGEMQLRHDMTLRTHVHVFDTTLHMYRFTFCYARKWVLHR